jgi:hypothetical protein
MLDGAPASPLESEAQSLPESTSAESAAVAHEKAVGDSSPMTEDKAVAVEGHPVAAE